jgi:hypothetical protein
METLYNLNISDGLPLFILEFKLIMTATSGCEGIRATEGRGLLSLRAPSKRFLLLHHDPTIIISLLS